ncbi:hypothetical protein [Thalassotalea marina]|uniref:Uncharacterized protein n=1 Tax=Thalassotalea marina TaxID=1673741 RepID=A0A919BJX6_9GAMM|nr:hypothetical protein [Thalassotalea marina]GHF95519.1 hypothetical protein GCM10017161_24790 [Thalassotalea marina]
MKLVKLLINALVITGIGSTSVAFAKTTPILKAEPVKVTEIKASIKAEISTTLQQMVSEIAPLQPVNSEMMTINLTKKDNSQLIAKNTLIAE